MIGKPYFLLSLLQAVVSEDWSADLPRNVTAQRGLCARIPCRYSWPSRLGNDPRDGIWFNDDEWTRKPQLIAFHSKDSKRALPIFRQRTRLSGDLNVGDCSLVINDVMHRDEGPYFFRIDFHNKEGHTFLPPTWLHVTNFTDKPLIFPAEMVEGKSVNMICTFNTTCDGTAPTLTWVTPADVPPAAPSSVTQRGDTLTSTSVLTLTPALKHHGQNLTCRVTYPSGSSEQTLTLTVKYGRSSIWKIVLITAVIIIIITAALAGFFIYKSIQKRKAKKGSGIQDPTVSYNPPSAIHQDAQKAPPQGGSQIPAGVNAGPGQGTRQEGLLYAQLQDLSCRDRTVPKPEATEYASIRFL